MIKFFLLPLHLILCFSVFAQGKTHSFEISLPEKKVSNSLYNSIRLLDVREDTTQMGIVQKGAFNAKAKVVAAKPLVSQIAAVMNALIDSSAQDHELLFQLRQLSFAEITGAVSEKGYCYLRAALYSPEADKYKQLATIDTVILIKSSWDVTKPMFRNGSKVISDFISNNLSFVSSGEPTFTYNDIVQIDSIEKSQIKIYQDTIFQDGIYTTWNSFKQQVPDKAAVAEFKNEKLKTIKATGENGKEEKVKLKDMYAVVIEGKSYIATEYGFYNLERKNGDLFFIGKAKVTANAGDVIAAGIFFGVIGSLIASNAESVFEMRIDHLNGGFVRLKEIN
jgi:hypothetical protein